MTHWKDWGKTRNRDEVQLAKHQGKSGKQKWMPQPRRQLSTSMNYSETYDGLCVLLEEYADASVEEAADQIFAFFALFGEDLLEALDPPTGLAIWLRSHGLSLMRTAEGQSVRVWATLEEGEEDEESDDDPGEGEPPTDPPDQPLPQVGDHVEYRTAPAGPNHSSQIGSGVVVEVGNDFFWVRTGPEPNIYIVPGEGDFIRVVS